jgi:hypothetical protein
MIRGIDYDDYGRGPVNSTSVIDDLADHASCERDIPHIAELGVNTLFISVIKAQKDHSKCMKLLHDAGIYVFVDLLSPRDDVYIKTDMDDNPWDYWIYDYFKAVIDEFQKYPNTLGFLILLPPYELKWLWEPSEVKGAVRDMKEYIAAKNYRKIPVGIFGKDWDISTMEYFTCGDRNKSVDFVGVFYPSNCQSSGLPKLDELTKQYSDFAKPLVLFRRCQHSYDEIQVIYQSNMTNSFSGAVFYSWFVTLYQTQIYG